jgi:hypothetical protein
LGLGIWDLEFEQTRDPKPRRGLTLTSIFLFKILESGPRDLGLGSWILVPIAIGIGTWNLSLGIYYRREQCIISLKTLSRVFKDDHCNRKKETKNSGYPCQFTYTLIELKS